MMEIDIFKLCKCKENLLGIQIWVRGASSLQCFGEENERTVVQGRVATLLEGDRGMRSFCGDNIKHKSKHRSGPF